MTPDIQELKRLAEAARDAKIDGPGVWAWVAFHEASTPSTILALIEAVKRQGEALEKIANSPTRGVGCNPALLFEAARAALKETTDV